jgi:hypothetical protein
VLLPVSARQADPSRMIDSTESTIFFRVASEGTMSEWFTSWRGSTETEEP